METNGSIGVEGVPHQVVIIMDIKCPDSGMEPQNYWDNLDILRERRKAGCRDEIKFVLCSERDFHYAMGVVREKELLEHGQVLFSPVRSCLPPEKLAALILDHGLPVKMQLQLHTLIWPDRTRGV